MLDDPWRDPRLRGAAVATRRKADAIRDELGMSAARYYRQLGALVDSPDALRHDPMLVKRLQRQREARGGPRTSYDSPRPSARLSRPDPRLDPWRRSSPATDSTRSRTASSGSARIAPARRHAGSRSAGRRSRPWCWRSRDRGGGRLQRPARLRRRRGLPASRRNPWSRPSRRSPRHPRRGAERHVDLRARGAGERDARGRRWPVGLASNADANDIQETVVYYATAELEERPRRGPVAARCRRAALRGVRPRWGCNSWPSSAPTTPSSPPAEPVTESLPFCDHS